MKIIDHVDHCRIQIGKSTFLTLYFDKVTWFESPDCVKVYDNGVLIFEIYDEEVMFFNQISPSYSFDTSLNISDLDSFRDFIMEDFEEEYFDAESKNDLGIEKVIN